MKKIIYIVAVLWAMSTSCSSFLEEYSQDLVRVQSWQDLDEILIGATYMQVNGYANCTLNFYDYIQLMGDEVEQNSNQDGRSDFESREIYFGYYTWQRQVGMNFEGTVLSSESETWEQLYKYINLSNSVLASAKDVKVKTPADANELKRVTGEAHFLRAAYYFTLVNLYAKPYSKTTATTDPGVPLKLTEYVEDKEFRRNRIEEVYTQILTDLDEAATYLKDGTRKSIYRADITAVNLLLSRVYLYMQNWEKAKYYADEVLKKQSEVIDLNTFSSTASFLSKTSPEVIFSMGGLATPRMLESSCYLTWDMLNMMMPYHCQTFDISADLMSCYAANDLRKNMWIESKPGAGSVYRKAREAAPSQKYSVSDKFLFRTAEAYLNKAEALCYLGDEDGARTVLNDFRANRIKGGVSSVTETGKDLADIIRNERRREFCFEGHRWFDLRRYTVCEKYPDSKVIRNSFTKYDKQSPVETWIFQLEKNDPAYTLPIPWEVLQANPGMENNDRSDRQPVEVIKY